MTNPAIDPHKVLGVSKDASIDEIKRAYRAKATKYHPDAGGDAWVFHQVQIAFETLLKQRQTPQREAPQATSAQAATQSSTRATAPNSHRQNASASGSAAAAKSQAERAPASSTKTSPAHTGWSMVRSVWSKALPLQTETSLFILVSVLDILLTYQLIRTGGREVNPVANWIFQRWNVQGLVYFKMAMVAFVAVMAQIIAVKHLQQARRVLILGVVVVSLVLAYSTTLLLSR